MLNYFAKLLSHSRYSVMRVWTRSAGGCSVVVARGGTRSGAPGLVGRLVRLLDLGDGPVVYHHR
jgi:hypothetical protein